MWVCPLHLIFFYCIGFYRCDKSLLPALKETQEDTDDIDKNKDDYSMLCADLPK